VPSQVNFELRFAPVALVRHFGINRTERAGCTSGAGSSKTAAI
jgi:hypothetical protein